MKNSSRISVCLAGLVAALPCGVYAARLTPDLLPPQKRQATVVTAEQLVHSIAPQPIPAELISPFNPPDFDKPEGQEAAPNSSDSRSTSAASPSAPMGDRQILEALASQLTPTGTIQIGGAPRLVMGSKRFEIGTRFTVTYNNQDYELLLTSIDRTTFTLRYRNEEITRPIKSVR